MAIDYGLQRIGLAITDPLRIIATPLDTIPTATFYEYFNNYLQNEHVSRVIVGMPISLKNKETNLTSHVKLFIEKLILLYPDIKIECEDERFTSKIAYQALSQMGLPKNKKHQKEILDKMSASLILQTYMEKNPS